MVIKPMPFILGKVFSVPIIVTVYPHFWGHSGSAGKECICSAEDRGDTGSISGLGRSPGEGNDNQLQYSCLKNSLDRGAWRATVLGVAKESLTSIRLSGQHTPLHLKQIRLASYFLVLSEKRGVCSLRNSQKK